MLRGGAFKPRTSPYSFQGMGEDGLKLMKKVGDEFGLPIVSECVSTANLDVFEKYADMIQIGARNMQNYDLLKKDFELHGIIKDIETWSTILGAIHNIVRNDVIELITLIEKELEIN